MTITNQDQEIISTHSDAEIPTKSQTYPPTPPKIEFDPSKTYYNPSNGSYLVDVKTHYRSYSKRNSVKVGIRRFLENEKNSQDLESIMDSIEIDSAIDWSGSIAGYKRGVATVKGKRFLVMDEANLLEAELGDWPLHRDILNQAFPDVDARAVFISWLRDGVTAVRKHHHHPAPMLVMAGERNAGKSLIACITQKALGGRASNPMATWSGKIIWNDELLKSELLLIDDSEASTDIRARKSLGANFKESIYGGNIKIHTRGKTAMDLRPVWRVMICCNETPENLAVIPPLEEGIEDKIILLKVSRIKTPMPAQSVEQKIKFSAALMAELPAFLYYIDKFKTPERLTDSRDGVTAWKDPHLLDAIREISPERRTEGLIALWLDKGSSHLGFGESKFMCATEVQSELQDRDSPTSEQAKGLLKYDTNCGRYLASLVKLESLYVTGKKSIGGITQYEITRPKVE